MDYILYRAKAECIVKWKGYNKQYSINDGDFVYGFYYKDVCDNEDKMAFDVVHYIRIEYGDIYADIEVNPDTVGIYIDNDIDGECMFVGDWVEIKTDNGEVEIYSISHDMVYGAYPFNTIEVEYECHVIGNIYDTPIKPVKEMFGCRVLEYDNKLYLESDEPCPLGCGGKIIEEVENPLGQYEQRCSNVTCSYFDLI